MSRFGDRRHYIHSELIPENLFHCRLCILFSLSAVIVSPQGGRANRDIETGSRYLYHWTQVNCLAHRFALTVRLGRCSFLSSFHHPDHTLRSSGDAAEPRINSIGRTGLKAC